MIKLFKNLKKFKDSNYKLYDNIKKENDENRKKIEKLFDSLECEVGIYEVMKDEFSVEYIEDIFYNGLVYVNKKNVYNYRSLNNMITFFYNSSGLLNYINQSRDDIDGYIIIKLLKPCLGKETDRFYPIYLKHNQQIRLLNDFIYYYVSVDSNGNIKEIIINEDYKYNHYLENKNLLYESLVEFKLRQKGIFDYYNQLTLDEQFSIIENAYIDTLMCNHEKQANYALRSLKENKVAFFYGEKNKLLLKKYIIYGDLYQLLSHGLNCDRDISLDDLIDLFIDKYSDNEFVKK